MNALILSCQLMPLLGMILIGIFGHSEQTIARLSLWTTHLMGVSIAGLVVVWMTAGCGDHEYLLGMVRRVGEYQFPVLFFFDRVGAVYLFCVWVIFSVIVRYCRYYMHREAGFKRFFLTIFAFAFGLNMVVLSGLLDMLFAGWEIVGMSSFLLIAFYRQRIQPIRNANRAYTIYRFCDLGLLLGAWLSDMMLHGNNHFSHLAEWHGQGVSTVEAHGEFLALVFCILIAAMGKSAQFPFCFWLPRAMEGPTPSSAIFYGALSVHLGVFLLLRTQPLWGIEMFPRGMVFLVGLLTVVVGGISERTQANIKGQIAYASITQVGFMFMELALGFDSLVLFHFLGNAFLRCYQLLVSPSIVAHWLRVEGAVEGGMSRQGHRMMASLPRSVRETLPDVLRNTLHVLALQEFNLETGVRALLWSPLMALGKSINATGVPGVAAVMILMALAWLGIGQGWFSEQNLAIPAAILMVLHSVSAFSQRRSPLGAWLNMGASCFLGAAATWMASSGDAWPDVRMYLSGVLPAWILGAGLIGWMLRGQAVSRDPFVFRAMAERRPGLSAGLFLCFLGVVSFPVSPAFLGQDLLLYHVSDHHPSIIVLLAISFVVNGITAAGLYLRLCMGRPVELKTSISDR